MKAWPWRKKKGYIRRRRDATALPASTNASVFYKARQSPGSIGCELMHQSRAVSGLSASKPGSGYLGTTMLISLKYRDEWLMEQQIRKHQAKSMEIMTMKNEYTAVIKEEGGWWIGWIEEVPGVNCQERTYEELKETLEITMREALEFNRQDALSAAGAGCREEKIAI